MRGATRYRWLDVTDDRISIHAPHAGCDRSTASKLRASLHFNPRTPCGVRPASRETRWRRGLFQSTHPMRGATLADGLCLAVDAVISIHAPHAGCDLMFWQHCISYLPFQSTHPMRGATWSIAYAMQLSIFQSTHPMRGATHLLLRCIVHLIISIHAPHAGCDMPMTLSASRCCTFQSTHPMRGATARALAGGAEAPHFNPRTPCGVRRENTPAAQRFVEFQSTHPMRGATKPPMSSFVSCSEFQSTHPMRGATARPRLPAAPPLISIHAPHAGCDSERVSRGRAERYFNPRTPCGVRLIAGATALYNKIFQSTHPRGVRQTARWSCSAPTSHFNPRTREGCD